jgi:hypothetical protein
MLTDKKPVSFESIGSFSSVKDRMACKLVKVTLFILINDHRAYFIIQKNPFCGPRINR